MTCEQSIRLIHLDRPHERSDHDTLELQDHLRTCAACAAESRRLGSTSLLEDRLRTADATIPALSDVRARVLAATVTVGSAPRRRAAPAIRLAYAAGVVAAAAWFAADQWSMRASHDELAHRLNLPSAAATGPQIVYTVDASAARSLVDQSDASPSGFPRLEGTIEVPQSTAQDLVDTAELYFVRTFTQRPERRAQVAEALRIFRAAVDVTIRFRSQGA